MVERSGQGGAQFVAGVVLAGLAMSVGWGIRGDYGHEAGALVPGALVALAVCLAAGREDWWRRAGIMGMAGAVGWAFGGQMSYGRVIGYTAASSFLDVCYGYASLGIIGGLWAGIGAAFLAMSVTRPRCWLEQFARPLAVLAVVWLVIHLTGVTDRLAGWHEFHDTDWVGAASALLVAAVCAAVFPRDRSACGFIAVLVVGWWAGYLLLVELLGLHMTPPRSDNWAGCTGLFVALLLDLRRRKDRVALLLTCWGFIIGGLGFVVGDFTHMLGRAQWGPIGRYEALQGLDYWKWMEQVFGLVTGLGVGLLFLRRVGPALSPPAEDAETRRLPLVSLVLLLVVMMWANLYKNVRNWAQRDHIPDSLLGVDARWWLFTVGVLMSAAVLTAVVRHRGGRLALAPVSAFGRGQLLFLVILWVMVLGALTQALPRLSGKGVFLVHVSFWITAALCSLIVLGLSSQSAPSHRQHVPPSDVTWRLGWRFWVSLALVPAVLLLLAQLTVASHDEPLPHSHLRFGAEAAESPSR
jgi:hypothetical protein